MNNNQHLWKILYLILSIVIAAGVWYYVDESSGRVVTQTVSGIPIEYINEDALTDKGLMLEETENSGTSTTVDITFKGRRRHIVQLDRSKVRVTADLSGITAAGVQTVTVTPSYTDRQFNQSNTTIDKQSIYAATVNICELSHKEVELRCELTGNVAEGYSAGTPEKPSRPCWTTSFTTRRGRLWTLPASMPKPDRFRRRCRCMSPRN